MKHRMIRLALAAAVAAGVSAPLTTSASAFVCAPSIQVACATIGKVCNTLEAATDKVECTFA